LKDCATDWENFSITKEADANNKSQQFGKELGTVQSVHVMKDVKEVIFDLKLLNVDQLQQLCKDGIVNCRNSTKYQCCVLISNHFTYKKSLTKQHLSHQTYEQQATSTLLHAINVVFSNNFIIDFLASNNCTSRVDHEMGTTHNDFYIHACNAHNTCNDSSLNLLDDEENGDNTDYIVNLSSLR
jgi:hypothetical protein